MTYSEVIQFLYQLRWFGAKFGLDNTRTLAALAGNPQHKLRFIHVAGTNGKGSTCAMLESIYRTSGLRVGLFTSPHLVAFGERIQVDRHLISEADVVRWTGQLQGLLKHFPTDSPPTFFEVVTVMALCYFAEQDCELVVWETGLGGRLDATNIVTPLASVITNIQFDHQQWLGQTLSQIAAEKAGIIKPGVPVITAADEPAALEVIAATARAQQAPLRIVTGADAQLKPLADLDLPLLGQHQRLNAALAIATVRALAEQIPVPDSTVLAGLDRVDWPGRFQLVKGPSGQTLVLDGAHNPAGAQILRAAFHEYFPKLTPTLILGVLRDKDWPAICRILAPLAGRLLLVPLHSERAATPESMQAVCRQANPTVEVLACSSLAEAMTLAADDAFVLLAGSLYLVGEALEWLHLAPPIETNERGLNEWNAAVTTTATAQLPA